ncbi:MAG TPA: Ca2+-dependent phosphoinositide-specific phospholipase C [Methylomirabilota bacterium]|nr:Ca2+-dependent phosphoinositide-specific phospholipase C [Methylomirabilota bacterium]
MLRRLSRCAFAFLLFLSGCVSIPTADDLRINEVQVIGSHNSYHIEPHPSVLQVIASRNQANARGLQYTHPPLPVQFDQGIRQIELDIFADPEGGRYARPSGPEEARALGLPTPPNHDEEGKMLKPGYKVFHIPNTDFLSTTPTLQEALTQVRDWSRAHPTHFPICVLLELKKEGKDAPAYTIEDLAALEREIRAIFPRDHILTPDDVRRDAPTLPDALNKHGWPTVREAQGKVMFALDNEDATRDLYISNAPSLNGKLIFVSVPENALSDPHPAAAWMKMNEAKRDFAQIQQMVRAGYLVRTRSDIPNVEVAANDTTRRDAAFASGAQFISSDYWRPDPRFSSYSAAFPGGVLMRANSLLNPNKKVQLKGR